MKLFNFISFETKLDLIFGLFLFIFNLSILILDQYYKVDLAFLLKLQILVIPFIYFIYVLLIKEYLKFDYKKIVNGLIKDKNFNLNENNSLNLQNKFLLSNSDNKTKIDFYNLFSN